MPLLRLVAQIGCQARYGFRAIGRVTGPPPKPAAQRRRRNRAPAPVKLSAEKTTKTKTPTLPGATRYSKSTRAWWATVWRSPMAAVWLEADVPALVRLAGLNELLEQGEATAMVASESLSARSAPEPSWQLQRKEQHRDPTIVKT